MATNIAVISDDFESVKILVDRLVREGSPIRDTLRVHAFYPGANYNDLVQDKYKLMYERKYKFEIRERDRSEVKSIRGLRSNSDEGILVVFLHPVRSNSLLESLQDIDDLYVCDGDQFWEGTNFKF